MKKSMPVTGKKNMLMEAAKKKIKNDAGMISKIAKKVASKKK